MLWNMFVATSYVVDGRWNSGRFSKNECIGARYRRDRYQKIGLRKDKASGA